MSVNPTELLKNAYGGTFEENVKTVLNKHFNSEIAENLWNQTCEKYSEFLQNHNIPEDDEDAVYYSRDKTLFAGDDCCNFSMRYIGKEITSKRHVKR